MNPRPELLAALIQQESGGNHNAVSPKGAQGLAQVMPQTGRDPGYGVKPLLDNSPSEQKRFANDYLGAMLKKYNGDEKLALAAYNAGPGNVDKYKGIPPFKETRNYVDKILHAINPISSANASVNEANDIMPQQKLTEVTDPELLRHLEGNDSQQATAQPSLTEVTDPELLAQLEGNATETQQEPSFIQNLGTSGANYVKNTVQGLAQVATHPLDTIAGAVQIGGGLLGMALPESPNDSPHSLADLGNKDVIASRNAAADKVIEGAKKRYGGLEQIKNTAYTDPVGMAGDLSSVLMLGGLAAPKLGAIGRSIEPINAALNATGKVLPKIGKTAASIAGSGLGTHTGAEPIIEAARAAERGGSSQKALLDNLRKNVNPQDVLDAARLNLSNMRKQASEVYRRDIAPVTNDRTTLDFTKIDDSINGALDKITDRGIPKNDEAYNLLGAIKKEVDDHKARGAAVHDVEGFDTLKQRIGALLEKVPYEHRQARMVGNDVYHGIKESITDQAPDYAKVMKDYIQAQDDITEIQKALSLGDKASADTAMRRLQSVMRNNVNTNYGNRTELARNLQEQGGNELLPSLAGQALSSLSARGLGSLTTGGAGIYGLMTGNAAAIPLIAMQSPRLVGEMANAAGTGSRMAKTARKAVSPSLVNLLQQSGKLPLDVFSIFDYDSRSSKNRRLTR